MGKDLVTIGVGLGLLGFLHNETEYHHIDCQRQYRDYALRCGVGAVGCTAGFINPSAYTLVITANLP